MRSSARCTGTPPEGDWRTNVALGGAVEDATDDMPTEAADTALYAADVMGLDYAGVDLVEGTTAGTSSRSTRRLDSKGCSKPLARARHHTSPS